MFLRVALALQLVIQLVVSFGFLSPSEARDFSRHQGYISAVEKERDETYTDIVLVEPPASPNIAIKEKIFNAELSREFKERYEDKFGHTEPERIYYSTNKYTYVDDLYTPQGTIQQVDDQKQEFGNYMVRRLVEYHADNYFKSDPSVRPIWEAKERLSSVKVEVDKVKFDVRYSLAGNILDLRATSPWLNSKVSFVFGASVGNPDEVLITNSKDITKTVSLENRFAVNDGIVAWVAKKRLTSALSTSLTVSTFTRDQGKSIRESLYIAGIAFVY